MADVFISYSRKDKAFAKRLFEALEAHDRDAWVDWEDIPPTVEWLAEIYSAIEAADTSVFVISLDSVASEVRGLEIAHAVKHNKPLVPIVHRDMDQPVGGVSDADGCPQLDFLPRERRFRQRFPISHRSNRYRPGLGACAYTLASARH